MATLDVSPPYPWSQRPSPALALWSLNSTSGSPIGDAVTQRAIDSTRAGRRENEVAGDAMQTLYYMGGEMAHVITPFVASGEHMSPPHRICTDKIIRNRDLCFIDIGAMWNGYFADIGRTTMVGKPSKVQKQVYTAVYEGLMAGIDQMRPGGTNQDAADAVARDHRQRDRERRAAGADLRLDERDVRVGDVDHGVALGVRRLARRQDLRRAELTQPDRPHGTGSP